MGIDLEVVSRDVGQFLFIPAGMALISLPVCLLTQEWFVIFPMISTTFISGTAGGLLYFLGKEGNDASHYQAFLSVALGWILASVVAALPFWLTAISLGSEALPTVKSYRDGLNALFEGVSGFTSTGLTMAIHPSEVPMSLQWWRSFIQWVGGVGVIVLALAIMEPAHEQHVLYQAEGRTSKLRLTLTGTVKRIWSIYSGYTLVSIVMFRICGMTWWEAINHGMTAIATGGFSITDDSMESYGLIAKLAIALTMTLGAISFKLHDQLLKTRKLSVILRDRQHFLLLFLLCLGTLAVRLNYFASVDQVSWIDALFQWVSALTTCGFSTQSIFSINLFLEQQP